ncbi:MAG: hypothetical protein AAGC57_06775 [Pseudomonadota bacterium]
MSETKTLRIAEVMDHGEGNEGALVGVKVKDGEGREIVLLMHHDTVSDFQTRLHAGATYARAKRDGKETKDVMPATLPVKSMSVGQRTDGRIAFRLDLSSGLIVDVPLNDDILPKLRDAFEAANSAKQGGTGTRH